MRFHKGQYVKIKHKRYKLKYGEIWTSEYTKRTEGQLGIIVKYQRGTEFNILVKLPKEIGNEYETIGIPSYCLKKATKQDMVCEAL